MDYEYAKEKDIKELYDLQLRAFESEAEMINSRNVPALMESYEENRADFINWTVLIKRDDSGKIIGAVRCRENGDHIEIGRVMVAQEHRNRGIATDLMTAVEELTQAKAFELYSGMRMGEINALRLDSIDFENNVVHVNATVSRGVGANWFIKDGTKTEAGVRDVPISDKLKPYLEEALKKYKKNKQKLLFYDCVSKRVITTTQVNSYYKRVCSSVGIESSGQHALRHTFATRCIEDGIPAVVLKTWLGHKDIHMTLDTYTDVFQAMDNDAINKYDEHLNSM